MQNPFIDIDKDIWKSLLNKPREPRKYIGASILGHPCDRRIWLDWKGNVEPNQFSDKEKIGQKLEIFQRGNEEEEIFIKKLEQAGYKIKQKQASFLAYEGKLKGHCDAIILDKDDYEYIFEFKTMQESSFKRTVKHGIEISYPHYITQIQLYMYFLDLKTPPDGIKRAIIVCQNKNRDYERHQEIHMINPHLIKSYLARLERIFLYEDQMPTRLCSEDKIQFTCKMCEYFKFCYPDKL